MDLRRRLMYNLTEDEDMGKVIFCRSLISIYGNLTFNPSGLDYCERFYIDLPNYSNCFYLLELYFENMVDSDSSTTSNSTYPYRSVIPNVNSYLNISGNGAYATGFRGTSTGRIETTSDYRLGFYRSNGNTYPNTGYIVLKEIPFV